MAVENGQIGGQQEGDDVRRRALLRLGVAGVVTAAALAGLWWLDQGGGTKPEKPLPTPIAMAPPQETTPPQPPPGETAPPPQPQAPEPAGETMATKPHALPGEAPPPPRVSNAPKRQNLPAVRTLPPPAPQAAAQTAATHPTTRQESVNTERFVVQLGVFSNPEHARELVDKLHRQGIHAHMETRVQLGPFDNREEAERARGEMQKLGMRALVTPAASMK